MISVREADGGIKPGVERGFASETRVRYSKFIALWKRAKEPLKHHPNLQSSLRAKLGNLFCLTI